MRIHCLSNIAIHSARANNYRVVKQFGSIIEDANLGERALEIEIQPNDAAVIDVGLPDLNGLDLLNKLQKIAPSMTKIILTGYPSDGDRTRALKQGADYYLTKPIKPDALIQIIESKLKKKDKP